MDKKNKILSIILIAAIVLCFSFAGGLAGAAVYNQKYGAGNSEVVPGENPQSNITINPSEDITIAEAIAKKVMPSVVGISTVSTQVSTSMDPFDIFGFGFGGGGSGYSYDTTAVGTGVIVDEAGYILTNSHVVNDGDTKSITVSLYDGQDVEGKVLWNDSTIDLAVVKIETNGLVAAELADSDLVNIGSYAAAIGNPLGLQFERSISQGIISGLDRTITVSSSASSSSGTTMEGLMQTDATINGGNSGGPLLNSEGKVIGINTAKASSGEGMGFAIPINVAAPIVQQIKETGSFVRAYIGISGIGLDEQTQYNSQQLIDNFGTDKGIYVSNLTDGGGAKDAGIRVGDIITKVDDVEVGTMNKINKVLVSHRVGDKVQVEYIRDKKAHYAQVTLTGAKLTITK